MNKESITPRSYPLGDTYFTKYKSTPPTLRDPHGGGPTEEQDLASRHRISHPLVSEQLTTTGGQPNKDPEDQLRWSRNRIVERAVELSHIGKINGWDADDINTKLRRDAEEIDRTIGATNTVDEALTNIQTEQASAKRRQRRKLAEKAFNLVKDMKYLQKRAEWLSGHERYKEKDDLFDPKAIVNTHDVISQRILNEVQPDGSTPMDMLHEQAVIMAQKDGVELNIDKPIK